jgi:hypothetical protein
MVVSPFVVLFLLVFGPFFPRSRDFLTKQNGKAISKRKPPKKTGIRRDEIFEAFVLGSVRKASAKKIAVQISQTPR